VPRNAWSGKREREYEALKDRFQKEGRYKGREKQVAARIVNKQRKEYGETEDELQKDREGRSPDRSLPIKDYQRLTISEITRQLGKLSPDALRQLHSYEKSHKQRKSLLEEMKRQLGS